MTREFSHSIGELNLWLPVPSRSDHSYTRFARLTARSLQLGEHMLEYGFIMRPIRSMAVAALAMHQRATSELVLETSNGAR